MTQQWTFTALEFMVLCDHYCGGSMPDGLLFVSDELLKYDEFERRKRVAWDDLQRLDGAFNRVSEVIRAPELYVLAYAWDEQDNADFEQQFCAHAARAGALAYVFVQAQGKLTYDSPFVTVTECHPRELAVAMVRLLPDVEAGRLPEITIVTDPDEHIAPSWVNSIIRDDIEDRPVYRTQRFFEQPAQCTGMIKVVQGRSKYGPRGIHETSLMWRDVIGDGRYLIPMDDDVRVASATSRQQLVYRIQRHIDDLQERLETHWESGRPEDRY